MRELRILFFCGAWCLSSFAITAQDTTGVVTVSGKVRDYDTGGPLTGVAVEARDTLLTDPITTVSSDSGKYALRLPSGHAFVITFSAAGHVAKSVVVDGRDIPASDRMTGEEMNIDITLLERLQGVDYAVMDRPIGRCVYSATDHAIVWDIAYTQALRSAIRATTDAHQAARSRMVSPVPR